jgi:peptide/nickel transport system substrate-binding protein
MEHRNPTLNMERVEMKIKRIALLGLTLLMALAILLSSCGGSTPEAPAPATEAANGPEALETAPATEPAAPTEETLAAGPLGITENVATHVIPAAMPAMDPDLMLTQDHVLGMQMYETLTYWTPDGLQPKLATSWESNPEGTEWTFHLREGVTFHDGTPFTADAVLFSLQRTIDTGLMWYYLDVLDEFEVVDDYTFVIRTVEPSNMPTIVSAGYGMFIVNPNIVDKPEGWFEEGHDAGTGPYTIVDYEPGTRWVLDAYPDYWGGWEEGQFTKVVMQLVEDETVREQMIRSGDADMTSYIPWDAHASIVESGDVLIDAPLQYSNLLMMFHVTKPPLDDLLVRQALSYSYPYEDAQAFAYGGKGSIALGLAPAEMWDAPADMKIYSTDLDRARALLDEAGVAEGTELQFAYGTGDANTQLIAQLWQAELAKVGIDLKLNEISNTAWWDAAYNPDNEYHIMQTDWAPGYASAFEFGILLHSTYTFNPAMGYANEAYDSLLMQARAMEGLDAAEANQLYAQAFQMLYDDAAAVFSLDTPYDFVYRSDISGFQSNPNYYDMVIWYDLHRQ